MAHTGVILLLPDYLVNAYLCELVNAYLVLSTDRCELVNAYLVFPAHFLCGADQARAAVKEEPGQRGCVSSKSRPRVCALARVDLSDPTPPLRRKEKEGPAPPGNDSTPGRRSQGKTGTQAAGHSEKRSFSFALP